MSNSPKLRPLLPRTNINPGPSLSACRFTAPKRKRQQVLAACNRCRERKVKVEYLWISPSLGSSGKAD
ncbi:hypothetical protein LZ31DRAFT_298780 [Colletotrichum somersetense]|nr:hypothetical protein LZ31DRAFT_298780 [Colletotrichum somersetense]